MGCETCGDKKPACDKGFTKAALEIKNPSQLVEFRKIVVPASLGDDTAVPPVVGKYCNAILYYEANDQVYLYSSDGIPTKITVDIEELKRQIKKVADDLADETQARTDADAEIWEEIETIEAASDVVDVVGTYAELQAYDTSKLHDKDLIKVLCDETRDDAITYYRWSTSTSSFSYVGAEGPYYTASETDTLLATKQDTLIAGANIQIASDGKTISATDTTYTHFTGATASTDGVQGLVPGPLAGDEDKFLKGDGTWADASYDVFTTTVDGLVPAPGSSSYRKYLLDDANWAPQIVEYAPSIDSVDGNLLVVVEKMSNGMNYTARTYDLRMTGATSSANGKTGFVPRPTIADKDKFLKGDGTWGEVATVTTFYTYSLSGDPQFTPVQFYKEDTFTTTATFAEVLAALAKGPVRIYEHMDHTYQYVRAYDNYSGHIDIIVDSDPYMATTFSSTRLSADSIVESSTASFSVTEMSNYTLPTATASVLGGIKVGSNLTISSGVLSANTLVGTDGVSDGTAGYAPAPLTTDAGKYLKSDGTWAALPAANNISSNDWSALWQ